MPYDEAMTPRLARAVIAALVLATLTAGAVYFATSFRSPESGREENVAGDPAGGRTQAVPPGGADPVVAPGDPLIAGVPEAPDIPLGDAHRGLRKIGERIREAVTADGTIGDDEVPGVDLAGLTQAQRRRFLDDAVAFTCHCGCNQDLLECRRDDVSCPISPGLRDSLLAVARARS
jgi:hypothetical protein